MDGFHSTWRHGQIQGSLTKKTEAVFTPTLKTGIICEINFSDPSGDNMLSEGETGALKVIVNNYTNKAITPKLTISLKVSINEIYN